MSHHLYGVVPAAASPPPTAGIGGGTVEVWGLDDRMAILRSPADGPVRPRRAHLTAHDRVLAEAMAAGPVLPLRFGIVADADEPRILDDLDPDAVAARWDQLAGRVEVQVLWDLDEDMALRRIAGGDPVVRDPAVPAIDRGRRIAESMTGLALDDLERIIDRLAPHLVARRPSEGRGASGARAAVLVEAGTLDRASTACGELATEAASAGTLRHVGGLPPYSFADLDVAILPVAS